MLQDYIPLALVFVIMALGLVFVLSIIPSINASRMDLKKRPSLRPSDVLKNLAYEADPPVRDTSYTDPYESGEVSKGEFGSYVNVQYYVIVLLFVLFDVDIVLLFPWAFNFKALGIYPFIETLIFFAMPLFAVLYAYRMGFMRWMK
ncbi:MAG: NADH-quinone oxidoreductase subunit A [Candidatus Thermoplasmatota archaeon]|nr:NADH-quinone oxidoreductase subunit A [Candidatus Thermoplasmatota archaeon]MCL5786171.1 NADH-quinone oxidoreductase subunit A [Candidatus Thermoplasmatota archaeon]